jgi:hypothetical protein
VKLNKKYKFNNKVEKTLDHNFSITESTIRQHNGWDLEALVSNILGVMTIRGEIDSFRKATSSEDAHGVDFFVKYTDSKSQQNVLPLQIKTSFCGLIMHEQKYGETIPCVYLKSHQSLETQIKAKVKAWADRC